MLGLDDHRTQRNVMCISHTAKIHGHRIKTGGTKRLDVGLDLFQMSAERFFAIIQATHHLKLRRRYLAQPLLRTNTDCVQSASGIAILVSI